MALFVRATTRPLFGTCRCCKQYLICFMCAFSARYVHFNALSNHAFMFLYFELYFVKKYRNDNSFIFVCWPSEALVSHNQKIRGILGINCRVGYVSAAPIRRRPFGAGHFGAGHFGAGTIRRQNFFF